MPTALRYTIGCSLLVIGLGALGASLTGCSFGECRGDADCPFDRVCEAGSCVQSCAYEQSRCSRGQVCVGGHCATACSVSADCPAGSVCDRSGVCLASHDSGGGDQQAGDEDELAGDDDSGDGLTDDAGSDGE